VSLEDSVDRVDRLVRQLLAPASGPRAADSPDGTVWVAGHGIGIGDEYAVVVPVVFDGQSVKPAWNRPPTTVSLHAIKPGGMEQPIPLGQGAANATHHLVLLWARVRTRKTFGRLLGVPHTAAMQLDALDLHRAIERLWGSNQTMLLRSSFPQIDLPGTAAAAAIPRISSRLLHARIHVPALAATTAQTKPASPAPSDTAFVFASCQYPAGLLDRLPADRSIDRLNDQIGALATGPRIDALLLLGDQIYADASYGILDPKNSQDRYPPLHQRWRNTLVDRPHIRQLDNRNRCFTIPDDHEIADNWEPGPTPQNQALKQDALQAFAEIQSNRKPRGSPAHGWWGAVEVGGAHQVFMLDTRTQREARPWGPGNAANQAHIIDLAQRTALETWLLGLHQQDKATGTVTPKFIASAVWLLPRAAGRLNPSGGIEHSPALSDNWDGYPPSLHWLLGLLARERVRGVVVLCGDGHLAGHTVARLRYAKQTVEVQLLHAPALYAPFVFANAQPHQFRARDIFTWQDRGHRVVCAVRSVLWPLGDGFVRVGVHRHEGVWEIRATFDTIDQPHRVCWTIR